MSHPVRFHVEPPSEPRVRITALVRPLLAVPHLLLVGGPLLALAGGKLYRFGALGLVALLAAFFDWIAIVVTGHAIGGLDEWKRVYLCWRARTLAYCGLLCDQYPPFTDRPYPATLELPATPRERDRAAVLMRPIYLLPHLLVLVVLSVLWAIALVASWAFIVVTGALPEVLFRFGRDVAAYSLRFEAYALLVHDEYPPFTLSQERAVGQPLVADGIGVLT